MCHTSRDQDRFVNIPSDVDPPRALLSPGRLSCCKTACMTAYEKDDQQTLETVMDAVEEIKTLEV